MNQTSLLAPTGASFSIGADTFVKIFRFEKVTCPIPPIVIQFYFVQSNKTCSWQKWRQITYEENCFLKLSYFYENIDH